MAKLPKVKKSVQDEEAVEMHGSVAPEEEVEETTEEQSSALESIMSSATQNAANAGEEDEVEDDTAEEQESNPDVSEHSEEDDGDAGENPETAPPEKTEPVITVSAPQKVPPKPTTVKVATVCDHSCYIGGVPYHFKKGVPTPVPQPVKDILRNAGLLMAL